MKKILFMLLFAAYVLIVNGLGSCTKEQPLILEEQESSLKKPIPENIVPDTVTTTTPYSFTVINECFHDTILMTGTSIIKVAEYRTSRVHYLSYTTHLVNMSGVGTSRLVYTGSASITGLYKIAEPGISSESYGKSTYKLLYSSVNGHYISYKDSSEHYQNPRGRVMIDYNVVNETCK